MDDLKKGQPYIVIAPSLHLRMEPTTNSQIVLTLKISDIVILESTDVQESDGYHWFNVRHQSENMNVVGWAASEYLEPMFIATAPPPTMYTFKYENVDRSITEQNLKTAVEGNLFSKNKLTNNQSQITLDEPFQDTDTYWVSRDNLKKVKISPMVT